MREVSSVMIEASVVGLIVFVIYLLLEALTGKSLSNAVIAGLAGAATHLACEYTGFNHWWYLRYQSQIA